jgi:hypothetical protein
MAERPPIGIMPEYIWKEARRNELQAAIERYIRAGFEPLDEWYIELGKLLEEEMSRVK